MRSSLFAIFVCLALASPAKAQESSIEVLYLASCCPTALTVLPTRGPRDPDGQNSWYQLDQLRARSTAERASRTCSSTSCSKAQATFRRARSTSCSRQSAATRAAPPNADRTNYWENVPSNALELALYLESDRMGYLLAEMAPEKVDGQRDVVKNERRESYENQPLWNGGDRSRRTPVSRVIPTTGPRSATWRT